MLCALMSQLARINSPVDCDDIFATRMCRNPRWVAIFTLFVNVEQCGIAVVVIPTARPRC